MVFDNKILFRFFFILSCLLIFPFPLDIFYYFEGPQNLLNSVYHKLIPWIGEHILHLENPITQFEGGSGDTTYNYVLLLFFVCLSVLGTLIWSLIEKRDKNYRNLNYIFLIIISYFLGAMMLSYGLGKVIPPRQFSEPFFDDLTQTYGQASPMGLLWTFMGYSQGYTLFSGLAETIGGLLLFHKRRRLLGSLILIPVLANVVALNFFYDVPVKLFSTQLLLFAIFIFIPDAKRVLNVILFNRTTEPKKFLEFGNNRYKKLVPFIKYSLLLTIFFAQIHNIHGTTKWANENGFGSVKHPLHGFYEVSYFVKNRDTIPALHKDTVGWRYVSMEYTNYFMVKRNNMSRKWFESKIDTLKKEVFLKSYADSTNTCTLQYKVNDTTITFSGIMQKDTLKVIAKKLYKSDFELTNRGFNWINEYPYNR